MPCRFRQPSAPERNPSGPPLPPPPVRSSHLPQRLSAGESMSLRADSATPALCASTSASGLAAEPAEGEEEGKACAGVRSKRRRRSLLTQRRLRHLTRPPHASRSPLSVDLTPLRLLLLLLGCLSTAAGLVVPAPQAFFQPKLIATHGGRSRLQVGPPLSVCLPSPQLTAALGLSSLLEKTCLLGAGALPDLWAKSPTRVEVVRSLFGRRHFFEHYAEQPALFAPLDTLSSVVCRAVFPLRYHLVREWHASRVHSAGLVLRRSKAELSRALASELRADVASLVHLTTRVKSAMSIFEKSVLRGKLVTDLLGMRLVVGAAGAAGEEACYSIARAVASLWPGGEMKDYIASPKANGYQSLHVLVPTSNGFQIEIQIRTAEMHDQAEHGRAAHALYKATEAASLGDHATDFHVPA